MGAFDDLMELMPSFRPDTIFRGHEFYQRLCLLVHFCSPSVSGWYNAALSWVLDRSALNYGDGCVGAPFAHSNPALIKRLAEIMASGQDRVPVMTCDLDEQGR